MKRSFAWLAMGMLLCPLSLSAQRTGAVKGVVLDEERRPLRAASISVVGTHPLRGVAAAPDGSYSIQGFRPGVYTIMVTMVGRCPEALPGLRVRAGKATDAQFMLFATAIRYDTIMVRATRWVRPETDHYRHGSLDPLGRARDEASVLPGPRSARGGERP